jgi:ABC-type lipoprotein release transport system permease subunit
VLRSLLYGVTTHDPAIFAGAALVLLAAVALATLAPSRRAARLNPLEVIRGE